MLDRIEEMVEAACMTKHPELLKAMNIYVRRATNIVQQAMLLRGGQARNSYVKAIALVADQAGEAQDVLLEKLGDVIASAEVRVLDPASFRLRTATQRRKALAVTVQPRVTRESRLAAAMHRAEAGAFALSNDDVMEGIRRELRMRNGAVRLSSLPMETATDVLHAMQVVEAIRSARTGDIKVTRLPSRLKNDYYAANDYLIEFDNESDKYRH
ncbi:MAG: DUF5716 family protein [Rhodocyclaceae bacterium]